jgi:chromosome segregation ATPase
MQLVRFSLRNFSSFRDTGWIELSPGTNLIVGPNNVGKSALLRAFDEKLADNRHRDEGIYQHERLEAPRAHYDVRISWNELESAILKQGKVI